MRDRDDISDNGVGIMGISKGVDIALSMATFLPDKINAVVAMNGCVSSTLCSTYYKVYYIRNALENWSSN